LSLNLDEYYSCKCSACAENSIKLTVAEIEENSLLKAFNKLARWIFAEKITKPTAANFADSHVQPLCNEIKTVLQQGFNKGITAEMPQGMKDYLSRNISVFSGAKTFAELQQMSSLLVGENGLIKPFNTYFKDVRQIHDTYNKNYLKAEYRFAQQAAQMADKWADFEQYGDRYLLQYRTAADDRVRAEHSKLHETTLPVSDSFWDKYFPPNGWRCRCTVIQVRRGKHPESDSHQARAYGAEATEGKQDIFRFNPGKQGAVFPENHPYYPNQCPRGYSIGKVSLTAIDAPYPICRTCFNKNACWQERKAKVNYWKKANIDEQKGLSIDGDNFKSGSLLITRGSARETVDHTRNIRVIDNFLDIQNTAKNFNYEGWARTTPGKHANADFFLYYSFEINGVKYYANVMAENDSWKREVLYCIKERLNYGGLETGELPDMFKYKK
jgi:SPP1 gp7 family putative phage head morphogenesis protein